MEKLSVDDTAERPINLTQALKRLGWVMHGGEAKMLIGEGRVRVNGVVELRKRRKLQIGDTIEMEEDLRAILVPLPPS